MKNVELTATGQILTITIDMTQEVGPSASGRNILIATTEGNVSVLGFDGAKIGLNVYKKKS